MKRTLCTLFVLMCVGIYFSVGVLASGSRDPITILGNNDFTAENGVVAGSGTAEDPYVIAGWEIDVAGGARYGVKVENATAHFILRGLILRGATDPAGAAIHLGFVTAATIEGTTITNSINGIEIASSTNVTLSNNVLVVSGQGLRVVGDSVDEYRHQIDTTNLVNDYSINYFYDKDGEVFSGIRSNNLYVVASRNVTIAENEIVNGDGIQLAFVENSQITNNRVYRESPVLTQHGISLTRCNGNTITGNELKNNNMAGILLWLSSENVIVANSLLANDSGVILMASDNNLVNDNVVFANPTGIGISAGSTGNEVMRNIVTHQNTKYGIAVEEAASNRLERNAILECETGIFLGAQGNNNYVLYNTIVGGDYGLSITGSYNEIGQNLIAQTNRGMLFPETYGQQKVRGNAFHDNVFADNGHHVYLNLDSEGNGLYRNAFLGETRLNVSDHGRNIWSVSGEGNFWEDYEGSDADGDGIGDDPVRVHPVGAEDTAPFISATIARGGLGVLATLEETFLSLVPKDGETVQIPVLIADEDIERFVGFRGFPVYLLEEVSGILFDYGEEVAGGLTGTAFTMRTVSFPLDIAFFDGSGAFVGSEMMEANSEERYTVDGQFRFALELASGTLAERGIGAGAQLLLSEEN